MTSLANQGKAVEKTGRRTRDAVQFVLKGRLFGAVHRLSRVVNEFLNAIVTDVIAEVLRRDVLEFVSLIENDGAVIRQDCGNFLLTDVEICKEQMMIDDHNVSLKRLLSHQGEKAAIEFRALRTDALVPSRINPRPQLRVVADTAEFGAVASLGFLSPIDDVLEHREFPRRE